MTRTAPAPAGVDGTVVGSRRAADLLGVDERTVVRWADEGFLPVAYRTRGGHRRYLLDTVTAVRDSLEPEAPR